MLEGGLGRAAISSSSVGSAAISSEGASAVGAMVGSAGRLMGARGGGFITAEVYENRCKHNKKVVRNRGPETTVTYNAEKSVKHLVSSNALKCRSLTIPNI